MTLASTVREAARLFGNRAAFVDPDGALLSYAALDARSEEVAAGLLAAGIGPGDVVVLRLPSVASYVIAYAATAKVGAIAAGVNPRLAPPEQEAIAAVAGGALTLTDPAAVDELARPGRVNPLADDPDRPVALVFTSGTTGTPKGALFCERQLAAVTRIDVADAWGDPTESPTPMLASTQFGHVGFMTKLPWYLRLGTTTHILGRWRAADTLACVAEHHIPTLGAVAPQVALLLREDLSAHDLSCLRALIVGAAASPPALVREARARLAPGYSIRYSSTESGGCGTGTAFDADDDEALHTVGRPRGGIEVEIRDPDGIPIRGDEVGEVWLRTPSALSEYWHDPTATGATLVGGWLRTDDLGSIDERGNLRLAGRQTEVYIRGGYNVHPAEVESALGDHHEIAEVVVVPMPDDVMGEIGVAVVVPAPGGVPPSLESIRTYLEPRLARFKIPEALEIVSDLPLTPMQKVDRQALTRAVSTNPR